MKNKELYMQYLPGLKENMPYELFCLAKLLYECCVEFVSDNDKLKIIYLANDTAECFIEFENFIIQGECVNGFEESTEAVIEEYEKGYMLIFRQGEDNTFTVYFEKISLEINLYNYGNIGHFWMKKPYDLRLIDYWLGIINDKYQCLGEKYCNELEAELAELSQFKPLRFYKSIPEKYLTDSDYILCSSEKSMEVFLKYALEAEDKKAIELLSSKAQSDKKEKKLVKYLARSESSRLVDLIIDKIQKAAETYCERKISTENLSLYKQVQEKADSMKGKNSVVRVFKEEPFERIADTVSFKCFILKTKKGMFGRKHELYEYITKRAD